MRTISIVLAVGLSVVMLVAAKDLLIPLVLAVFLWHLIRSLGMAFERLTLSGRRLPEWLALGLSVLTIVALAVLVGQIVGSNLTKLVQSAPQYQEPVEQRLAEIFALLRIPEPPTFSQLLGRLDLSGTIVKSARALAGLVGQTGLVAVYLLFLFIEEKQFARKLDTMFPNPARRHRVMALIHRLGTDTRTYIGLKSLVSLVVAASSYFVMEMVGLEFAGFWALLIFILNFIPNLGSIVATALPSIQALIQFDDLGPTLVVIVGVSILQFVVAYVLEPRLLSSSLNLSPLAVILSLVLWGSLWGIPGMFLCVPIMVNLMIVCSLFPRTRPIAILMSRDGQIAGHGVPEAEDHPSELYSAPSSPS